MWEGRASGRGESGRWSGPGSERVSGRLSGRSVSTRSGGSRLSSMESSTSSSCCGSSEVGGEREGRAAREAREGRVLLQTTYERPRRLLVHLDLKGAPPLVSYLLSLLPFFKKLGATGLVMEYEDTFPYITHQLAQLPNPSFHYNREELGILLDECERLGLEVIPLVQTFGHAEFVLKHAAFKALREHPWFPNCFCPSNPETMPLLKEMLQQTLEFHPNSAAIHIGCDEVWQLGICERCVARMEAKGWSKERLFAAHVVRLADFVKEVRPDVEVLIWDDMMRTAASEVVVESGMAELVQPVVWWYGASGCPDVWPRYSSLFPSIWAASAFKGASGSTETTPDTMLHVENHKLWSAVVEDQAGKVGRWGGLIVTGWSRYDHFGVLVELLPAGLPSLALCLSTFRHGAFSEDAHREASALLGLGRGRLLALAQRPRPQPLVEDFAFPGALVCVVSHWQANLYASLTAFANSDLFKGWFHPHNVKRNFVNPGSVRGLLGEVNSLLSELEKAEVGMLGAVSGVFPDSVAHEWIDTHLLTHVRKLRKLADKMQQQIAVSQL